MNWILAVAFVLVSVSAASAAEADHTGEDGNAASQMAVRAFRLGPGADLKKELSRFAREHGLRAGVVLTCVGSLTRAVIRLADRPEGTTFEGKHEIVSLVGTLSPDGDHLHIAISDATGRTVGGHLLDGSLVYTTAEIAIGEMEGLAFARVNDPRTTYGELVVRKR